MQLRNGSSIQGNFDSHLTQFTLVRDSLLPPHGGSIVAGWRPQTGIPPCSFIRLVLRYMSLCLGTSGLQTSTKQASYITSGKYLYVFGRKPPNRTHQPLLFCYDPSKATNYSKSWRACLTGSGKSCGIPGFTMPLDSTICPPRHPKVGP